MQIETISLDEFFNKYKGISIYKIEYLIDLDDITNENCIYSFDDEEWCIYHCEIISSKDDVKKYDNLFLRPLYSTFVSGVVIDDKVFCIIGDTSEEEKLDDSIIKNLMADPNKSIYDIHVEFVL